MDLEVYHREADADGCEQQASRNIRSGQLYLSFTWTKNSSEGVIS